MDGAPCAAPGTRMLAEIREQPERVRDAFSRALTRLPSLGGAISQAPFVALLGRGSSRSAATYGASAIMSLARRPAFLLSPAEVGWGDCPLPLRDAVVVAISQSGRSREMVAAAKEARSHGARLIVVTNTPFSELALLAERPDDVFACCAGDEVAVPATKSFTTSLACLLALASAHRPEEVKRARDEVPRLLEAVLADPRATDIDISGADQFVLAGESYGEAVAEEGAIKLRETLRVSAASFETSEFLHGSINSSAAGTTIFTIGGGPVGTTLAAEVAREAAARGAQTFHVGDAPASGFSQWIPVPEAPPSLASFAAIVPIQLAARAAALKCGLDPDRPSGLTKVTLVGGDGEPGRHSPPR